METHVTVDIVTVVTVIVGGDIYSDFDSWT